MRRLEKQPGWSDPLLWGCGPASSCIWLPGPFPHTQGHPTGGAVCPALPVAAVLNSQLILGLRVAMET